MKNIKKLSLFFIFASLSVVLAGCSGSNKGSVDNNGGNNGNTGTDPLPELQLTPAIFDFGTITEGNTASPFELTISNIGTSRLDIASILLSDTNNYQLDINAGSNPCGTASPAIDAGTNCTAEISFQPGQVGTFPANLELASNDANSPTQLSITGRLEAAATLSVTINQVELAACPNDVTAFVSVTDQGDFPVPGLGISDFTIEENSISVGSPAQVNNVEIVNKPISIALVMDNSGSMRDTDIAESNRSALEIVDQLGVSDEVEIIKFGENVDVIQGFTSDKQLLRDAINGDYDGDGTALFDAVQKAVDDTSTQASERKSVIVITDGVDVNSVNFGLQDIIVNAQLNDIPVFVIALGENVDINTLQQITIGTSAELYEAAVAQNIRTIIEQQLSEILFVDQYVLTYSTSSSGGSDVDLKVTATNGTLTGIGTRTLPLCP